MGKGLGSSSSSTFIFTDLANGFLACGGELDGTISSSNALELEVEVFLGLGTTESTIISLLPEELETTFDFGVDDEESTVRPFGVLVLASPLSIESAVVLAF